MATAKEAARERDRLIVALRAIDGWIGPQGPPGVGAVVWHRGAVVAERYAGEARTGAPVDERTIFPLASVTKPVTAALVMTMVEEGLVSLDEPVVRLVPEFRADPEAEGQDPALERLRPTITTRQLLSHTSGLPEDLGPRASRYADKVPLEQIVDAMCRAPLRSAPGTELRYSNAGYGVLTRLVERIAGQEFWAVARRRVLQPMRLRDTVARPGPEVADRIALLADAAHAGTELESYNGTYWRDLAIPWGGLFGSPRDLARFAGAFLPSGAALPHLLSAPAAALMIRDQAEGVPGGVESAKVRWEVAHWGLGWEVKGSKRRHWTGELTSPATFCHFGAAGTLLWADPERDLALAVFANRTAAAMWSFIMARWARLSNAVVAAVG
ncbi:MAG: beta-lactamase family protein [Chloroflexota bacterium]|nr:beta-lactamase family protein [Chloroflexota bacterium]